MLSAILFPCATRNYLFNITINLTSSTDTNLLSVELIVLIFCALDYGHTYIFPKVMVAPVWLFIYGRISYDAPIHYFMTLILPSASRVSGKYKISFRCIITLIIFLASSRSGLRGILYKNTTVGWMSGLVLFDKNKNLATWWWTPTASVFTSI